MIIRMTHPVNGATHVYDKSDMERLRGYGWTPEGEPHKQDEKQQMQPTQPKRGRPPKAK